MPTCIYIYTYIYGTERLAACARARHHQTRCWAVFKREREREMHMCVHICMAACVRVGQEQPGSCAVFERERRRDIQCMSFIGCNVRLFLRALVHSQLDFQLSLKKVFLREKNVCTYMDIYVYIPVMFQLIESYLTIRSKHTIRSVSDTPYACTLFLANKPRNGWLFSHVTKAWHVCIKGGHKKIQVYITKYPCVCHSMSICIYFSWHVDVNLHLFIHFDFFVHAIFIIYVYTFHVKLCEHTIFLYIHRYEYVSPLFVESLIEIGALIKTPSSAVRESFSGTNVGRGL